MRAFLARLTAPLCQRSNRRELRRAAADWRSRRDELKATFLNLARASGMPHDLFWSACDWTGPVRLARERATGLLTAFAGIVVHFEAVEGGEMEDVEAVSLPRDATAVFQFRNGWQTAGQALFNMAPSDAITRLGDQIISVDPVGEEFTV